VEVVGIAIVDPAGRSVVEVVVPGASACGQPNLFRGGLAAQDEFAAVGEFDADDAVAGGVIDLIGIECLEPLGDRVETLVSPL